ncbi:unnamed protein product [Adineta ricciae]|uniref:Peptidase M14 domain-containing protein n=1 Tax=Adineta ricciae TaxID=249248 RepID=A0A813PYE8_ADIRI|nr:unnamed protein product [Adineta ricciae]
MAPKHMYDGVPFAKLNRPTAPPIETVSPRNQRSHTNEFLTTRTTHFPHLVSTIEQSYKRIRYRRRNRTRLVTTTPHPQPQHVGIVISIYDPVDPVYSYSESSTQRPWWQTAHTTTQSFYDRFPKLPPNVNRPPPPTVPRSFTTSTTITYHSTTTTSTTTTTTTTTPASSTFNFSPASMNPFWLDTVPSFTEIIDQYPRYPTIIRWFHELSHHPNISRFFAYEVIGHTHENRSIVVAKIGLIPFQSRRRSVWLDGGIHAREWISTATVLYTIARLINGTLARDPDIRILIDSYDFYFMPVVNPDGYVYTHDDIGKVWDTEEQQDQQRMWRKNRRPHTDCPGVDLNRNFPFAWDNRGASKFPCEETYRGPYPESEPEVRAITSFILKRRRYFHSFITLHAFGNFWMLPFSFTTRIRPYDYHRVERLLSQMNRLSSNTFKIGQSSTVLYPATGTSEDWAKAIAQIPHTFSVELPPSSDVFDMRQEELNGFTYYADKEIGTVAESTYRLLHLYLKNLAKLQSPSRITI